MACLLLRDRHLRFNRLVLDVASKSAALGFCSSRPASFNVASRCRTSRSRPISKSLNVIVQIERRPGIRFASDVLEIRGFDIENKPFVLWTLALQASRVTITIHSLYIYALDNVR